MKKVFRFLLALTIILTLMSSIFAIAPTDNRNRISTIYGIPMEALDALKNETIMSLSDEMLNKEVISSEDTYFKVSYAEDGTSTVSKASYQEYIASTKMRATAQCSWMKIHTTILDIDDEYAQISAAYTWLTRPFFRMTDVVGLAITQGTIVGDSASGFYVWTTPLGRGETNFSPDSIDHEGHGVVRTFQLANSDLGIDTDYVFLRARIHKESGSEGLSGTYGHQRASISFSPSFDISRQGTLSCVGINLGMTYDTFRGYTDIAWTQ